MDNFDFKNKQYDIGNNKNVSLDDALKKLSKNTIGRKWQELKETLLLGGPKLTKKEAREVLSKALNSNRKEHKNLLDEHSHNKILKKIKNNDKEIEKIYKFAKEISKIESQPPDLKKAANNFIESYKEAILDLYLDDLGLQDIKKTNHAEKSEFKDGKSKEKEEITKDDREVFEKPSTNKTEKADYLITKHLDDDDLKDLLNEDEIKDLLVDDRLRDHLEIRGFVLDNYKGDTKDGVPHGKGKITYSSGAVYEGNFEMGKPQGLGTITYPDESEYVGDFKDGVPHGKGTLVYANGNIYTGDFKNSVPHGNGMIAYANGNVYKGDFKEGEPIET